MDLVIKWAPYTTQISQGYPPLVTIAGAMLACDHLAGQEAGIIRKYPRHSYNVGSVDVVC